ncbi:hypothetical protein C491_20177 [Natronococcus amylolyticus DSM 10524]|uniref:Uncharacterized protein n=1 Tax=Natronococcus amylolyticus DSM 10524 TaxID=1227497 RepID=L9WXE9_9EURY|nr:hypothetical protein [Natronococcus amylolyticus]ELY54145.1 hypothetical protein C491_20177 [Natronococcus amylolyticus DSM 10524]
MRRRTLLGGLATGFGAFVARDDDATASIERRKQRCASDEDDAATARIDGGTLVLEGLIRTPTPCHVLVLESVSYERDALEVTVGVDEPDGFCVQCLGVVEYVLEIEFDGRVPDCVAVFHERRDETVRVARERLDGGTGRE